jgi:hypothetical protein
VDPSCASSSGITRMRESGAPPSAAKTTRAPAPRGRAARRPGAPRGNRRACRQARAQPGRPDDAGCGPMPPGGSNRGRPPPARRRSPVRAGCPRRCRSGSRERSAEGGSADRSWALQASSFRASATNPPGRQGGHAGCHLTKRRPRVRAGAERAAAGPGLNACDQASRTGQAAPETRTVAQHGRIIASKRGRVKSSRRLVVFQCEITGAEPAAHPAGPRHRRLIGTPSLETTTYVRKLRQRTMNGDVANVAACEGEENAGLLWFDMRRSSRRLERSARGTGRWRGSHARFRRSRPL